MSYSISLSKHHSILVGAHDVLKRKQVNGPIRKLKYYLVLVSVGSIYENYQVYHNKCKNT